MILYHPVDDVYHCFSRIILLIFHLPLEEYDLKKIQILDYYFLFPGLLKEMTWPKELSLYKKYINGLNKPYSKVTNEKSLIIHLEHQIDDVMRYMAAYDLIDIEKLKIKKVLRKNDEKYKPILEQIKIYDNELLDFLVNILAGIPLNGKGGLKYRTSLFEYRYDNE